MATTVKLFISGVVCAAALGWAGARAQDAPAAPAASPGSAVQVQNGSKQPIVAVYVSAAGRADWSDDMLGKGTLKPGQSRKLNLKAKPDACQVDFSALLDSGETVKKANVDMCAAAPAVGF